MNREELKLPLLVVSANPYMRGVLKFVLETRLHLEVTELDSEEKALTYLREVGSKPAMIIYDYNPHAYLLEDFVTYLHNDAKTVRIIVLIDKVREEAVKLLRPTPQIQLMDEPRIPVDLVEAAKTLFSGTPYENTTEYCRVDLKFLSILDGINKNLYIKIGEKFIKLFQEDDDTQVLDLEKYLKRGVEFLYLKRTTADWVIDQIQKQINIFLKTNNFRFVLRGSSETAEKKFEQKILRIGTEVHIDQEFQQSVEQAIEKIKDIIEKDHNVGPMLAQLKAKQSAFAYYTQKINATSLIACSIARQLEWNSRITIDKLVFAAVICDITLAVRPHLIKIQNLHDFSLERDKMSQEEIRLFLNHPKESSELLKKYFSSAPPETDVLAIQHHELPDGSGFPYGLKADKISPLSALFIIANDFAYYFLEENEPHLQDFLLRCEARYDFVNFRKVVKALERLKKS